MFTIKLSEKEIITAKPKDKPYRLTVGGGLYVLVNTNKTKAFRFDYTFNSVRNTLGLGSHPNISLFEALVLHREAQQQLEDGFNPSAMRKAEKQLADSSSTTGDSDKNITFEQIANEWGLVNIKDWVNEFEPTKRLLETGIYPLLGNKPIGDVRPEQLLYAISQIEKEGFADKAKKTLGLCERVFNYAIERKLCLSNPALPIKELKAKTK